MASNTTNIDFDEIYQNFKKLCFEKYGKHISDKDPVILQFLMFEMFTRQLAKSLSEFISMSQGKLNDLADLWAERAQQSFKALEDRVKNACARIESILNHDVQKNISLIFTDLKNNMVKDIQNRLDTTMLAIKKMVYIFMIFSFGGGFAVGYALLKLFG